MRGPSEVYPPYGFCRRRGRASHIAVNATQLSQVLGPAWQSRIGHWVGVVAERADVHYLSLASGTDAFVGAVLS